MSNTYTAKPDLKPCETNPFLPDVIEQAQGKIKSKNAGTVMKAKNGFVSQKLGIHDLVTGEILENESLVVAVKKAVDTEEFTKVFTAATTALFDLSKRAIDVFLILVKMYNDGTLAGSNDLIYFKYEEATSYGYKRKWHTFRSGLNELMHNSFLVPAAKGQNWYWINPTLFYRGDRVTLINQYVLTSTASLPGEASKAGEQTTLEELIEEAQKAEGQ